MTTQQLNLFNGLYLVLLVAVAVLTRARARRIAGSLAGGAAAGVGQLRAGGRPAPGGFRALRPVGGRGAWGDAAGRRPSYGGPVSAPPMGGRRTRRCT